LLNAKNRNSNHVFCEPVNANVSAICFECGDEEENDIVGEICRPHVFLSLVNVSN
jgi:hypothetical protein